jgi:hypothetical protein
MILLRAGACAWTLRHHNVAERTFGWKSGSDTWLDLQILLIQCGVGLSLMKIQIISNRLISGERGLSVMGGI